ncbi:MAG: hypothetical protein EOO56_09320 [Hymenobacter sp.]|nr:MAG: hypothetical protein EOO56_09320 [Hymenobacter sp.]
MPASAPFLPPGSAFPAELLPTLLEVSLAAVLLLRPVYAAESGELTDFMVEYLNPAAQRLLRPPASASSLLLTQLAPVLARGSLDFYRRVFATSEASHHEVPYEAAGMTNHCYVAAQRQGNWLVVSVTNAAERPPSASGPHLPRGSARAGRPAGV